VNHRLVQRRLFRMQLDAGFAARVRAGEGPALAGLGERERQALAGACAAAVAADREGRRRAQFLQNVTGEFALACAAGVSAEAFPSSPEFHAAVEADASLPLAFAAYAERCCPSDRAARALLALEQALARARRAVAPSAPAGRLALAPGAVLRDCPAGTLDLAGRASEALRRGDALPRLRVDVRRSETVLIRSAPALAPFGLREVAAELATPDLVRLLDALDPPCTPAELAQRIGETEADLIEVVDGLVRDGIALRAG
jgi:hypothetical protein